MLMRFENGKGWANATGQEIEELKKIGWVESSPEEHQKFVMDKKNPKKEPSDIDKLPQESVIITPVVDGKPKGKPGRKPKNITDESGKWQQRKP